MEQHGKYSDFVGDPLRGDFAKGDIPLTPLLNVGRATLKQVFCAPFVNNALKALYCIDFFRTNILEDRESREGPNNTVPAHHETSGSEKPSKTAARDAAPYRQHIETLSTIAKDGSGRVLFPINGSARSYANYFAVVKDIERDESGKLTITSRAIFDGRTFNTACRRPPVFGLCGVEAILAILGTFGTKKLHFYSTDLRNFYYQVKLGNHVGMHLGIFISGKTLIPGVLPMGWSWACWVAQGLCWGVILFTLETDDDLGIPEDICSLESPPASLTMLDGTVIVVIYDTILVVGNLAAAENWKTRIERNMNLNQLLLKYSYIEDKVDFAGITISSGDNGTAWEVQQAMRDRWIEWTKEQTQLIPTPLVLWKAMGYLRFIAPVVGLKSYALGRIASAQSRCAKRYALKSRRDYKRVAPELAESIAQALNLVCTTEYKERHRKSHLVGVRAETPIFAATDATLAHESYTILDPKRHQSSVPKTRRAEGLDIQETEGNAIVWCIEDVDIPESQNSLLVMVGDNQPGQTSGPFIADGGPM